MSLDLEVQIGEVDLRSLRSSESWSILRLLRDLQPTDLTTYRSTTYGHQPYRTDPTYDLPKLVPPICAPAYDTEVHFWLTTSYRGPTWGANRRKLGDRGRWTSRSSDTRQGTPNPIITDLKDWLGDEG